MNSMVNQYASEKQTTIVVALVVLDGVVTMNAYELSPFQQNL
jgi:hypothetical protein